jgi:hypothetical protein
MANMMQDAAAKASQVSMDMESSPNSYFAASKDIGLAIRQST